jgi:TonB family protein
MNKLLLVPIASILATACAAPPTAREPQYILEPGGKRLSRQEAERVMIERALEKQITQPRDGPLRIKEVVLPTYPAVLRRGNSAREGKVRVAFTLNTDGTVSETSVVGSPDPLLAALCIDAVLKWRFHPITLGGAPRMQKLTYEFVFALE